MTQGQIRLDAVTLAFRSLPDDPFEPPGPMPTDPESVAWADALAVRAERARLFDSLRAMLRLGPDTCPGCYVGDDGPACHDTAAYGCTYWC